MIYPYKAPRITPAHKLPPPEGTDPLYLQTLINKAAALYVAADEDVRLDYFIYMQTVKKRRARALANV